MNSVVQSLARKRRTVQRWSCGLITVEIAGIKHKIFHITENKFKSFSPGPQPESCARGWKWRQVGIWVLKESYQTPRKNWGKSGCRMEGLSKSAGSGAARILRKTREGRGKMGTPEAEIDHSEEAGSHAEQLQDVQERIEAMGLFLPQPPPPDSDEEDDPEGAAAHQSQGSIPMDEDHVELVKRTMAAVNLPSLGIPAWAQEISDDQWKDMVQQTLQSRQSSAGLRLQRK
ncbi:hypothetical protein COCON_G00225050 [Conger conger]|uniref:Male-enhanced antigen 1 n=1 Tax=Conger conger TaxID=82655 RepID=A0A9Q1CWU2_CONCO|nr:hypothetical protein COCON_G00225050 [Conger conger]